MTAPTPNRAQRRATERHVTATIKAALPRERALRRAFKGIHSYKATDTRPLLFGELGR